MLLSGTCEESPQGAVVDLMIGPKPFLQNWLQSFGQPDAARAALVEVKGIA